MRKHTLQLDPVQLLQQPGGDSDGRMLRVAPGCEGVGRRVVDDVDVRLGQTTGDAQAFHKVVEPLKLHGVGRIRTADLQSDGIGLPVREESHPAGKHQSDKSACDAVADEEPDCGTDQHQDQHERGNERNAAPLVSTNQFEHDEFRTGPWAPRGRPRRSRSTRAFRTSASARRTRWGMPAACCCS